MGQNALTDKKNLSSPRAVAAAQW